MHPKEPGCRVGRFFPWGTEPTGSVLRNKRPLVGHAGCEDEEAQQEKNGFSPVAREVKSLLDVYLGASFFQLGLGGVSFVLGDCFQDDGGSAFNQFLGVHQAETGLHFADGLNYGDLVGAGFRQDDVEFGLLFFSFGRSGGSAGGSYGSSGGNAPLFFQELDEVAASKMVRVPSSSAILLISAIVLFSSLVSSRAKSQLGISVLRPEFRQGTCRRVGSSFHTFG